MVDLCIVCKQPKKIPTKMQKGVNRLDFERDPFCSRICAEAHYGTAVVSSSTVPLTNTRLRRPTGLSKIAANRA